MVDIIFMAAGNSRRFGENKLLYKIDGKPMFMHGLFMLKKFKNVTVITRYEDVLFAARELGMNAVFSLESEKGASFTIKAAINVVKPVDRIMFVAADQPYLSADTVQRLIDSRAEIACAAYNGECGNPVVFSAKFIPELLELTGDMGGRKVLARHREVCELVDVGDIRELLDIDYKEEELN